GYATFFYQGGNAGHCGQVNDDNTPLVALTTAMYGGGNHCGKNVKITNKKNGKTVTAKVADSCPTCQTTQSLDLSVGAFQAIASLNDGQVEISWTWA
ncbi:barwin-like endoglucanase, partial [Ceraceosorus guamensis]